MVMSGDVLSLRRGGKRSAERRKSEPKWGSRRGRGEGREGTNVSDFVVSLLALGLEKSVVAGAVVAKIRLERVRVGAERVRARRGKDGGGCGGVRSARSISAKLVRAPPKLRERREGSPRPELGNLSLQPLADLGRYLEAAGVDGVEDGRVGHC